MERNELAKTSIKLEKQKKIYYYSILRKIAKCFNYDMNCEWDPESLIRSVKKLQKELKDKTDTQNKE